MSLVFLTAFGVGFATIFGALLGFIFRKIPHKWNDGLMSFATGIMLAAAVVGLIQPSLEIVGAKGSWITAIGILCGAVFLNLMDKVTPHLHRISGIDQEQHNNNASLNKIMLFVFAIAIHNFPEGLAAGVGFGSGNTGNAISVAAAIALQNIPEGIVTISPLILAGVKKWRALLIAASTGLIEIIGTFAGYFGASISAGVLPFALAFAGGTMLYVISDEMIPETHSHGYERLATYSLIVGFIVMLLMDLFIK